MNPNPTTPVPTTPATTETAAPAPQVEKASISSKIRRNGHYDKLQG